MFTKRIVPYLDMNNGCVVKGINFVDLRDAGDPVGVAATYDKTGADELVFLDIAASSGDRRTVVDMVSRVAETVLIPFTVGGGIRTVENFRMLFREGTGRVSINPSAIDNPRLVSDAADKFGRQCVVIAIDARRRAGGKDWNIYKYGGRVDVGIDALEWIMETDRLGTGEILLTSIDYGGTRSGYNNELAPPIASHVPVPVIASGDVGDKGHFCDALTKDGADAVLTVSLFHYKELEIRDLKEYLSKREIAVRI